jgi:hypothetical protein
MIHLSMGRLVTEANCHSLHAPSYPSTPRTTVGTHNASATVTTVVVYTDRHLTKLPWQNICWSINGTIRMRDIEVVFSLRRSSTFTASSCQRGLMVVALQTTAASPLAAQPRRRQTTVCRLEPQSNPFQSIPHPARCPPSLDHL